MIVKSSNFDGSDSSSSLALSKSKVLHYINSYSTHTHNLISYHYLRRDLDVIGEIDVAAVEDPILAVHMHSLAKSFRSFTLWFPSWHFILNCLIRSSQCDYD